MPDPGQRRAVVRAAIRAHLVRYPLAGDTVDGILANWLSPLDQDDAAGVIEDVLVSMVDAAEVARLPLPGGGFLYVRGAQLLDD